MIDLTRAKKLEELADLAAEIGDEELEIKVLLEMKAMMDSIKGPGLPLALD